MLGHLGINVPHLQEAKAYYDEIMPLVGYEPFITADDEFAFMPAGDKRGTYLFLYPATERSTYSRHQTGLQHLAFMMPTRAAVDVLRGRVDELESQIVHAPQHFPQYPQPYDAMFWLDPFGLMLEAVCHHDRP